MEKSKSNWANVAVQNGTIFEILNNNFNSKPNSVPSFKDSDTLIIGSDYSGESKEEPYRVYSFLISGNQSWLSWETARIKLRDEIMPDTRRMSYKKLGDRYRRDLLLPILKVADSLEGLSVTLAVNKKCSSLFVGDGPLNLQNPDFARFQKWQPSVLEKAFTVLHVLGFLIAGTAKKGQNVFWFTDEDAIAANKERLTDLTKAFGWISSQYLTFDLGHIRCGTTQCDDGSLQIEDFVAIPDLIAGALSEQFRASLSVGMTDDRYMWLFGAEMHDKAQPITFWLGTSQKKLKKHLFVINPNPDTNSNKVSWFNFTH